VCLLDSQQHPHPSSNNIGSNACCINDVSASNSVCPPIRHITTDMTLFFLCAGPAVEQDRHAGRITQLQALQIHSTLPRGRGQRTQPTGAWARSNLTHPDVTCGWVVTYSRHSHTPQSTTCCRISSGNQLGTNIGTRHGPGPLSHPHHTRKGLTPHSLAGFAPIRPQSRQTPHQHAVLCCAVDSQVVSARS
jgi:hypothetical protein